MNNEDELQAEIDRLTDERNELQEQLRQLEFAKDTLFSALDDIDTIVRKAL